MEKLELNYNEKTKKFERTLKFADELPFYSQSLKLDSILNTCRLALREMYTQSDFESIYQILGALDVAIKINEEAMGDFQLLDEVIREMPELVEK